MSAQLTACSHCRRRQAPTEPPSGKLAKPMDAVTRSGPSPVMIGSPPMPRRMRSAISARSVPGSSGEKTRNSSPPQRTTRSVSRTAARMRRATSTMTASPAAWPCQSLTFLKWSMSTIISAPWKPSGPASACCLRCSMTARKCRRLDRWVSGSRSLCARSRFWLTLSCACARRMRSRVTPIRASDSSSNAPSAMPTCCASLWLDSCWSLSWPSRASRSRSRCLATLSYLRRRSSRAAARLRSLARAFSSRSAA
mmetsp:Transcript_9632/g.22464  ORF Transcript_9632/g.22464 Transcript_9632/m.22464 type:complete len:253 (+) Transcript_9632:428-1186(+)